jgi:hypothetical protein
MSGTVTPDKADITFSITSADISMIPVFKFSGQHYKNSAKLVTSGDKPTSEGRLVYEKAPDPSETKEGKIKSMVKIIASAVAGVFVITFFACCFCCLMRSRRKRSAPVFHKADEVHMASMNQPPPPQYQPNSGEPYYSPPQGAQGQFVRY